MKKCGLVSVLLLIFVALSALRVESESFRKFLYLTTDHCAYDNWQGHISEGLANPGYNAYAPFDRQTNGFGAFHQASADELAEWRIVIDHFIAGDIAGTDSLLTAYGFPYETVEFHDEEVGRTYYVLRELLNNSYFDDNGTMDTYDDVRGSFDYGWGLYVYDPSGEPVIITTPHPCDDFPAVPLSYEAFTRWHARYWYVSGAGREVAWTHSGTYDNSKSLSDPSRVTEHPLNYAYQETCNLIRTQTGHREFSAQIHTHDWNLYPFLRSCHVSTGASSRGIPNLPIRDLSNAHLDLFNALPSIIFPANTLGSNATVTVDDYIGTYYSDFPFYYHTGSDSFAVYNNVNLAGYPDNRQFQYTVSGISDYEQYDPFFHIEEDELPDCYPQTTAYLSWFYSWDSATQMWSYDHIYDKVIAFYTPWIDAMASVLPAYLQMDNQLSPTVPGDLHVTALNSTQTSLQWTPSSDYDFFGYEILYSTEPIENGNYATYSRAQSTNLISQGTTSAIIPNLAANTTYYFAIRGTDQHGNVSPLSNEVSAFTGSACISSLRATRQSGSVQVSWTAVSQNDNLGFLVFRSDQPDTGYTQLAGWDTDPSLVGSVTPNQPYTWTDPNVVPDHVYYYRVNAVAADSTMVANDNYAACDTGYMYQLTFTAPNAIVNDAITFGINTFASDGYESGYDLSNPTHATSNYVDAEFYESSWDASVAEMSQEIFGHFDPTTDYRMWTLRIATDRLNQNITVNLTGLNGDRPGEVMYLRNGSTYWNLATDTPVLSFSDTNYHTLKLYWGRLLPNVAVSPTQNQIFLGGNTENLTLNIEHRMLIQSLDVFARAGSTEFTVATDLPSSATGVTWEIPDVYVTDLQFVVRVHYPDGESGEFTGNGHFGITPANYDYVFDAGWSTHASPVTDPVVELDTTQVHCYAPLGDDDYIELTELPTATGYWTYSPQGYAQTVHPNAWVATNYTYPLSRGWNLIPNELFAPILIKDFDFAWNDVSYTFAQACDMGLLAPVAYVCRDGYRQADSVAVGESFYLWSRVDDVTLSYIVFTHNDDMPNCTPDWQLVLTAEQTGLGMDEIRVGAANGADEGFQPLFDLPEPPHSPNPHALVFTLPESGSFATYGTTDFNREIRAPLGDSDGESRTWAFALRLTDIAPVTLHVDRSAFPAGYGICVRIQNENYWLTNLDEVTFCPFTTDLTGTVTVYNQPLASDDPTENAPAVRLSNAPNPFNPETTIRYSVAKAAKVRVSVYNLRGQLVKTLVDERQSAGEHSVRWDGRDEHGRTVATGVYFCRLEGNHKALITRKMLLLK